MNEMTPLFQKNNKKINDNDNQEDNDKHTALPALRRVGSSTVSCSVDNDNDNDSENDKDKNVLGTATTTKEANPDDENKDKKKNETSNNETTTSLSSSSSTKSSSTSSWLFFLSSLPTVVATALSIQYQNLTDKFQTNSLPWENGPELKCLYSGVSGILFLIPTFMPTVYWIYKVQLGLQAILSILADYIYVDQLSYWHGIDRVYATMNFIILGYQVGIHLKVVCFLFLLGPFGCKIAADRAKQSKVPISIWHQCHLAWHVASALVATFTVYYVSYCPEYYNSHWNTIANGATTTITTTNNESSSMERYMSWFWSNNHSNGTDISQGSVFCKAY